MLCKVEKCVGCLACDAVCPVNAIHIVKNEQGFLQPQIDMEICTNCKTCESVCPVLKETEKHACLGVYAAQYKRKDIRQNSSSGGMFGALARKILDDGGAVVGAAFGADHSVKHILIESKDQLSSLRGSKYVQSNMEGCYSEIKTYLESGKTVLFSGTPCQADAVQKYVDQYVGQTDGNLITCDLVCHGVPSPEVFKKTLGLYEDLYGSKVKTCNFRKKSPSWNLYSMEIEFEDGKKHLKTRDADPYLTGFLKNMFLRPSCYDCPYADVHRVSDITLADFWGYVHDNEQIQNDNRGISLVLIHTKKGEKLFASIKGEIACVEKTMEEAGRENPCLHQSYAKPAGYESFWKDFANEDFRYVCQKYFSVNGKLYMDEQEPDTQFDEVTIIPSDAVGSKGDEAMLRGLLHLLEGKKIHMLTPRQELWKGWLLDKNESYTEEFTALEELLNAIKRPTHLVIVGADIMDGLYGDTDTMTRLDAAERVIEIGGKVDVFSCSFRADVSEEILRRIINIGNKIHFHFRDRQSLGNFKKQTGLDADYFPDLAFLCEKTLTEKTFAIRDAVALHKKDGMLVAGVNFNEHACQGFYNHPTMIQRKQYIASVIQQIDQVFGNHVFYVVIPHDLKHWEGHFSDEDYTKWAVEYIVSKHSADSVMALDNYLTETELLSVLPDMDVVISGRMHLTIAAIRSGVVPIGYIGDSQGTSFRNIEKFKGMFLERLGRDDLAAGTEEEFEIALRNIRQKKEQIREKLLETNALKTDEMMQKANLFRKTIGLPVFDKDAAHVQKCAGHMTGTIAYIMDILERAKNYQEQLRDKEQQILALKQSADVRMKEKEQALCELRQEKEQALCELRQETDKQMQKMQGVLQCKEGHIELLLQSERDLQNELYAMRNSRTWRAAELMHKPIAWVLPADSKRRLFAKIFLRLLRHPVLSIKLLSPRKIRHFFSFLEQEGPAFVAKRLDESMQGTAIQKMELDVSKIMDDKPFEAYGNLSFRYEEHPLVSIVIPVYNQFAYTYQCLLSILQNTGSQISYEIIVANDCSTDDTARLHEIAENVKIITNEENLGFLKNCNHAAGYARGAYVLFLNNDTQVQEDWLEPLVQLMERADDIGMAGSKLVYADGKLQEAGGIVWKDASAWNYGNRSDPENPEFNYVKEADYISGAAIMIRTSLWKEIGGFDELFAPAYYEDTDLAFAVRKHGYKVMYQPRSVVVHFEGITNGTDVADGQKAYQEINKKKFYQKWKDVLEADHFKNGESIFLARDRSKDKRILLMVDHYVPMYDKDAGSRCMFYYLNLFVKMGYCVKFIGDNFYKHEPYTAALQNMGIEVLYGNDYYHNWKSWLKLNGKYFDYAFLSRPHISIKYIDFVREYSKAKIIYFGHDLHYLREMREYQLNGSEQALKDSKEWKKTELELMRKADVSYYLSKAELEEIAKADASVKVRRVPINIYSEIPDLNYQAVDRRDIIFVGGFGHPPNVDAVIWLGKEIMPKVWAKMPEITLHIIGSNPPQEIQDLACRHIKIHGFVSDEDLEKMYQGIRLAVVPLRYGAGIKGKIIEAMMRGIPMVTTSIGIEGIEGAEQIVKVSDEAGMLADFIVDLYGDTAEMEEMAVKEHRYIVDNYSEKEAVRVLKEDFEFLS